MAGCWLLASAQQEGGKRACTIRPRTGLFSPSSLPLQPISAANRLSSLSKRCEVEVGALLRLAAYREARNVLVSQSASQSQSTTK